jgi:DNA-3-methyladenine glycosylase I
MTTLPGYCGYALSGDADPLHREYHDTCYGFPLHSDDELFGRLLLEINQAGLSWTTILRKSENFRRAYSNFSIDRVAAYGPADRQRLLSDPGIVRNRLKVEAAIHNAGRLLEIRASHGGFREWLAAHHPLEKAEWVKLFRATFRFTGGEIVNEFLMSTGYLPGAHHPDCPTYQKVIASRPAWM